jgi:hypothetical protein
MSDSDDGWGCLRWAAGFGLDGFLILLFVVGIIIFFVFGPSVTLNCTRRDASEVFCTYKSQTFMLGGSIGGIRNVQRAVNEQKCDGASCKYRIVLETADGKRPLTNEYTSGSKADLVDKLNAFIADKSQSQIELTQSPDLSCLFLIGLCAVGSLALFLVYRIKRKSFALE